MEKINDKLNLWEEERMKNENWNCATFLFKLDQLDIKKNDSAIQLFIKCIKGFFIIIWIAFNFLFQPIVCVFWIIISLAVSFLVYVGMNLPGNKYNLTFSYKGKK